jgi:uncharacterized membrane protein (UPF0127 family)
MSKYFLIALILSTLLLVYYFLFLVPKKFETVEIKLNDTNYTLEVAKTMAQLSQGLSNRPKLCERCGMIFIFNKEGIKPFWMKDTLIPLDMIWLDSKGKVVSIQTAQPEPNTSVTKLKIYQNDVNAKYVIELNANDSKKLNLKIGDIINLPDF